MGEVTKECEKNKSILNGLFFFWTPTPTTPKVLLARCLPYRLRERKIRREVKDKETTVRNRIGERVKLPAFYYRPKHSSMTPIFLAGIMHEGVTFLAFVGSYELLR